MRGKGQPLPQLVPLSGHQAQLNREVLDLLAHVPVAEEWRWGRRLPGGAWGRAAEEGLAFRQHGSEFLACTHDSKQSCLVGAPCNPLHRREC